MGKDCYKNNAGFKTWDKIEHNACGGDGRYFAKKTIENF